MNTFQAATIPGLLIRKHVHCNCGALFAGSLGAACAWFVYVLPGCLVDASDDTKHLQQ